MKRWSHPAASALAYLALMSALGAALVLLYRDADQQDAGYHFLFARWSWSQPLYFISVWGRPLFTLLYSIPAQISYPAAKLLTVSLSLGTAWQSYRLANRLSLPRAPLAIPLLLFQPAFFLTFPVTLTEPLFAFVFVLALRLDLDDRPVAAMSVAALLILIRPEGFFLGLMWGIRALADERMGALWRRALLSLSLASGMIVWWAAAWAMTGDPGWIARDWPPEWAVESRHEGGPLWWYIALLPLIVGPLFLIAFVAGLARLARERRFLLGLSSFLTLFALHSLMYWRGWFGDAGYPRYLVCVAPATSIIALRGWNALASRFRLLGEWRLRLIIFALAALVCLIYFDGWRYGRDARAIDQMMEWFQAEGRAEAGAINRLLYSQSYMCIRFDCGQSQAFTRDRATNLALARAAGAGTLVFWDDQVGPKWYDLRAEDFEAAGFRRLRSQQFSLGGWFYTLPWERFGGPRHQTIHLLYKDPPK